MSATASYRAILIAINIIAGAINTTGTSIAIQLISFRTNRWSSRDSIISTSFIPICRLVSLYSGFLHVYWRRTLLVSLLYPQTKRP